jgi:N-acetylneuraminic acid mutarotase
MPHVVLGGKVYVPGGIDADRKGSDLMEVYDPDTDTWSTAAALPLKMHHLGAAAVDGKLYVLGGYQGDGFGVSNRVFAYDPSTDAWLEKASMPSDRGAHAAVAYGGKIYAIGGARFSEAQAANEVYDPSTDTWTALAPMPTAREHLAAALVDTLIYVVGGRSNEGFGLENRRTLEAYDPSTDSWTTLASMPTARGGLTAAAAGGRLYVFGGEAFGEFTGVFSETEEYDPATGSWRSVAAMPLPRHGIGAAAYAGEIYIIGGGPVAGYGTTDVNSVFTPPEPLSTAVGEAGIPEGDVQLHQNFPNPVDGATTIRFVVPGAAHVRLAVFDLLGREVAGLSDGPAAPALHAPTWPAGRNPGRVTQYYLDAGGRVVSRRMLLVR